MQIKIVVLNIGTWDFGIIWILGFRIWNFIENVSFFATEIRCPWLLVLAAHSETGRPGDTVTLSN